MFRSRFDGAGIYSASKDTFDTIASRNTSGLVAFGNPVVNSNGTVAFSAIPNASEEGVYKVSNGVLTTEVSTGQKFSQFRGSETNVNINTAGDICFFALTTAGGSGAFIKPFNGGNVITVSDETTNPNLFVVSASMNDNRDVAFRAFSNPNDGGIFKRTSDGVVQEIVNLRGPQFSQFVNPNELDGVALNNAQNIVFAATDVLGNRGIYGAMLGVGTPYKVVGRGDLLFGSPVTEVSFSNMGFSNNNDLAFRYTLQDGRIGMAVARLAVAVPEVGTGYLMALILSVTATVCVVRRCSSHA